ncbi:hypothetical protein ATHL_02186, partial [Anaerolinea thermolimosa]
MMTPPSGVGVKVAVALDVLVGVRLGWFPGGVG